MTSLPCECCSIVEEAFTTGLAFNLGSHWTCNVRVGHQRPGLVVQSTRHCADLEQLSGEELSALGRALRAATHGIRNSGAVERVYVQLFNETQPSHVHFHVVPRFVGEQDVGPSLPDSCDKAINFDVIHALKLAADEFPGDRTEPSAVVRAIRRASDLWNRGPSLYRVSPRFGRLDRAETYVFLWISLWTSLLVTAWFLESWVLFAVIAALWSYRFLDITLYEVGILLDSAPTNLVSVPRALVLRVLNVFEVLLTTVALLLSAVGPPTGTSAIRHGYALAALQPDFNLGGVANWVVLAVNWIAVLIILTGGVAMLIGKIGETFTDSSRG